MNRFEDSSMTVDEAREVAERFVQAADSTHSVSVAQLAQSLHARPAEIEALLEQVRGRAALQQAQGREHRNVWITGLAALGVGVVFMGLFFAGRAGPSPSTVIIEGPPVIWERPDADAPLAPAPDPRYSSPDALAPSPAPDGF